MSWSIKFTLAAEAYGLSYRGRPAPRSIGRVHLSLHVALANRLPLSGALFSRPPPGDNYGHLNGPFIARINQPSPAVRAHSCTHPDRIGLGGVVRKTPMRFIGFPAIYIKRRSWLLALGGSWLLDAAAAAAAALPTRLPRCRCRCRNRCRCCRCRAASLPIPRCRCRAADAGCRCRAADAALPMPCCRCC